MANVCWSMQSNMVGYYGPNQKQQSVFMSTFNKYQVPQTRTPVLQFLNNVICKNSNSSSTENDTARAVFDTGDKPFSKGIRAIEGNLAGCHFDDIIIDTGSAVSLTVR